MPVPLLAVCAGAPDSGKDTVVNYIQDKLDYNPNTFGFSCNIPFAEAPKDIVDLFLVKLIGQEKTEYCRNKDKDTVIPELGISYRGVVKSFATGWARTQFGQDFWTKIWEKEYLKNKLEYGYEMITCNDLRHLDEYQKIRELGGTIWYVDRQSAIEAAGPELLSHPSEGQIKPEMCDLVIDNNGTLYDLYDRLDEYFPLLGYC